MLSGRFGRAHIGAALCLVFLMLYLSGIAARAQTFPELTGRVVDEAGMLSPQERSALAERLAAFERQSSDQVVVATVPDLQGYEIADYANRLARHWALGREGEDNGVLLLVARQERSVRIEVGYGLEAMLTDALSRIVIENDILPRFRNGDFSGGIAAGADAIVAILSGDAAEVRARAERNAGWQGQTIEDWFSLAIILFIVATAVGPIVLMMLARLFGRKLPGGRRRFLGMEFGPLQRGRARRASRWGGGLPGGFGGGSGGFSGGGGSFGGGGASGRW